MFKIIVGIISIRRRLGIILPHPRNIPQGYYSRIKVYNIIEEKE